MDIWHIIIQPALVTLGAAWGLWYLTRAPKKPNPPAAGVMAATGAISKSYNPHKRTETPSIGKWNMGEDF